MPFDKNAVRERVGHFHRLLGALSEAVLRLRLDPDLEDAARPVLVESFFQDSKPLEDRPDNYLHACLALRKVLTTPESGNTASRSPLHVLKAADEGQERVACSRACFAELWRKWMHGLSPDEKIVKSFKPWNLSAAHVALVLGVSESAVRALQDQAARFLAAHRRCPHLALILDVHPGTVMIYRKPATLTAGEGGRSDLAGRTLEAGA